MTPSMPGAETARAKRIPGRPTCRPEAVRHQAGTTEEQIIMRRLSMFGAAVLAVSFAASAAFADEAQWSPVADALGKAGSEMPGGVYRIGLPRTDLHITLDDVE